MKPSVRSLDGLLQLCYNLPYRIHASKAYPLTSPNGSTIIVYGHEQGLRFVWRGGRPFEEGVIAIKEERMLNGGSNDAIMIDDSSDEEPATDTPCKDSPDFQDEEQEYDPKEPYEPIVQTLDVPFGVEVLHLAFPHLPPALHRSTLPPLLSDKVLVAVACSDCSIRLVTLPLTPPSPQSKATSGLRESMSNSSTGKSLFGEQTLMLSGGRTHQSIPKGVSISATVHYLEKDSEDEDMEDDKDDSIRNLPSSRYASRSRSRSQLDKDQPWDILVSSHSADLSGILLVHRIPLVREGSSLSTETQVPWFTQHLGSPAVSVEFSSALYPAPRHSQLFIAEAKGAVRVLDCMSRSKSGQASWLLSLYTDFETSENTMAKRKAILGAQWVLGGKAILALQSDGRWIVWDYEGAGPKPTDTNNIGRTQSGGSFTTVALEGWVGASLKSKPLLKSSSSKTEARSKFVPMTPSTRKMKQDALFTGPTTVPDGPIRGGLFVAPTQESNNNNRLDDESVLLWHGTNVIVIPSFITHWQNKVRGSGNLFGSGAKGEPKTINNIQLGGEFCNEIGLITKQQRISSTKSSTKGSSTQAELLVTGEKRLLIICPPLTEPEPPKPAAPTIPRPPPPNAAVDQQLLARGELDVNGMDRILAGMSNGHAPRRNSQAFHAGRGQNLLSI